MIPRVSPPAENFVHRSFRVQAGGVSQMTNMTAPKFTPTSEDPGYKDQFLYEDHVGATDRCGMGYNDHLTTDPQDSAELPPPYTT